MMHDIEALQKMIHAEYGESLQFVANYTPEQVEAWVQVTCELHSSDAVTMTMIHALLGRIAELESQIITTTNQEHSE